MNGSQGEATLRLQDQWNPTLPPSFFFFFKIYLFFGCVGSSLLCKGFLYLRGVDLLFAACGLFIAVASLVTEPGL